MFQDALNLCFLCAGPARIYSEVWLVYWEFCWSKMDGFVHLEEDALWLDESRCNEDPVTQPPLNPAHFTLGTFCVLSMFFSVLNMFLPVLNMFLPVLNMFGCVVCAGKSRPLRRKVMSPHLANYFDAIVEYSLNYNNVSAID